jgi:hypothetical protein
MTCGMLTIANRLNCNTPWMALFIYALMSLLNLEPPRLSCALGGLEALTMSSNCRRASEPIAFPALDQAGATCAGFEYTHNPSKRRTADDERTETRLEGLQHLVCCHLLHRAPHATGISGARDFWPLNQVIGAM